MGMGGEYIVIPSNIKEIQKYELDKSNQGFKGERNGVTKACEWKKFVDPYTNLRQNVKKFGFWEVYRPSSLDLRLWSLFYGILIHYKVSKNI